MNKQDLQAGLEERRTFLGKLIKQKERALRKAPAGSLRCKKNHNDPEYCGKTLEKIETYLKNGYYPGISLVMTFESKSRPLDTSLIRKTASAYFL